jgi:hypothetical protein
LEAEAGNCRGFMRSPHQFGGAAETSARYSGDDFGRRPASPSEPTGIGLL